MKTPKIEKVAKGTAEWAYLRQNYLDALMEAFLLAGDNAKLREYVREGGDLDKGSTDTFKLREIVSDMMEPDFAENPKGKKSPEMISFYLAVCGRILSVGYQDTDKRNTVSAATKFVAENLKPHPIEFKTAEKQFAEGRNRFIEKFGKPWIET